MAETINDKPISQKEKKDFIATLDFWEWSAETGRRKEAWPEYERIEDLFSDCAYCEYVEKHTPEVDGPMCSKCPLYKHHCCHWSDMGLRTKRTFWLWDSFGLEEERKIYAKRMANAIRRDLVKRGIIKEVNE